MVARTSPSATRTFRPTTIGRLPSLKEALLGDVKPFSKAFRPAIPNNNAVPLSYLRDKLVEHGASMLQVLSNCRVEFGNNLTPSTLPKELELILADQLSGPTPSHCLAIYNPRQQGRRNITLFPVHSIVLNANCANLPTLSTYSDAETSVPVVPLRLPSAETFGLLLSYLYTKDIEAFRKVWAQQPSCELQARRRISLAKGMLQNCGVLGVQDREVVSVLEGVLRG